MTNFKFDMLGSMVHIPKFGVSFSLHRCSELGIDKKQTLQAALEDLGFRRFRLMSYWNIHEPKPGVYNFTELDWQFNLVAKYKGGVSLCIGKRQPRWPECHMPKWAQSLPKDEWYEALFTYIGVVVNRYKNHPALQSWQLENEALLKEFGHCVDQDYNLDRLQKEFDIVKSEDSKHPVIMTLSDSWGLPWRGPSPDAYAMSLYKHTINKRGNYAKSKRPALFYKTRALLISTLWQKPVFIHELQAEPWLAQNILRIPIGEQLKQFGLIQLKDSINFAHSTGMHPIDLWGLEWWYWLDHKYNRPEYWQYIKRTLNN